MNTEKMTIHRALAELKLIDSKIDKAVALIEPTGVMQMDKLVNGFYKKEDFEANARSRYQSVVDLINRKIKIKSAIVTANAVTKVKIGEVEMTIAEAINFKTVITAKRNLITVLTNQHRAVKAKYTTENENINRVALDNAKIMIGKQGDNGVKPTDNDVKNIVEPFVKRNEYHLVDPLDAEKLIEKLQNEVNTFEMEVDAALSEINAITIIEL